MKIISSNNAPMFDRDVIVITKVLKIMYRFLPPLLRSLTSLNTLKDLNTVATPLMPNLRSNICRMTPVSDPRAIKKSNMFHSSLKYYLIPQARSLTKASARNIEVNM